MQSMLLHSNRWNCLYELKSQMQCACRDEKLLDGRRCNLVMWKKLCQRSRSVSRIYYYDNYSRICNRMRVHCKLFAAYSRYYAVTVTKRPDFILFWFDTCLLNIDNTLLWIAVDWHSVQVVQKWSMLEPQAPPHPLASHKLQTTRSWTCGLLLKPVELNCWRLWNLTTANVI